MKYQVVVNCDHCLEVESNIYPPSNGLIELMIQQAMMKPVTEPGLVEIKDEDGNIVFEF